MIFFFQLKKILANAEIYINCKEFSQGWTEKVTGLHLEEEMRQSQKKIPSLAPVCQAFPIDLGALEKLRCGLESDASEAPQISSLSTVL